MYMKLLASNILRKDLDRGRLRTCPFFLKQKRLYWERGDYNG